VQTAATTLYFLAEERDITVVPSTVRIRIGVGVNYAYALWEDAPH